MRAIITADLHLRPDKPRCRLDEDWDLTQETQLRFIADLAVERKAILCICGDIFHKPKVPDEYKIMFLNIFKNATTTYIMSGQHDQPYHDWGKVFQSSFGILWSLALQGEVQYLQALSLLGATEHFGEEAFYANLPGTKPEFYFFHRLIFKDRMAMPPNVNAQTAAQMMEEYSDAKWIFSGDNHTGFHYERRGRHVIVPGSMNRQASNTKDYEPGVYFVDTDEEVVEKILIPDDVEMVTDEYVQEKKERNDRIDAFVSSIQSGQDLGLDFIENVKKELEQNQNITAGSEKIINGLLGGQ